MGIHLSAKAAEIGAKLFGLFVPPEPVPLSQWTERPGNIVIPEGQSARRGRFRNWVYMRGILDSMGDPEVERVTVMKSARLGYTKGLAFAAAGIASTDPGQVIILAPTDEMAKRFAIEEIEPLFNASPNLSGLIRRNRQDGRSTLLRKALMGGGSLKILSGRAPSKLRAHDAKTLMIDEADAMVITSEGDPIKLAEMRTFAHSDRKIIMGSTPTEEGVSAVERSFLEGDQRVFKVPCVECGVFSEIEWENIEWETDRPETACWQCPNCRKFIPERWKPQMIEGGVWVVTNPIMSDRHHSYRINALVSLLAQASWPKLAEEYIKAKRAGPSEQQVFTNTVLGRPWRVSLNRVDGQTLASRVEPWGLATQTRGVSIPVAVLLITAGVDVQDNRLEMTILGWRKEGGSPLILGHLIFDGNTLEPAVWSALDKFHRTTRWKHPRGWRIGIDAMAVDSGGSKGRTQVVYDWCYSRLDRRIYAIKGQPGPRKIWERAKKVKGNMRLINIAVDILKTAVMDALAKEPFDENGREDIHACRYSDQLTDEWFEQATNEVRRIKYKKGSNRPEIVFERKRAGLPVEALDCTVYGWAVRQAPSVRAIDLQARLDREPDPEDGSPPKPKSTPGSWASVFNSE